MKINEKLAVLEAIAASAKSVGVPDIQKILFVCVQHLLHTSASLFETLIELGAEPSNIFLIGKHYSTCDTVSEKIKNMGIQLQKLTPLQKSGEYASIFNRDISAMWQQVQNHLNSHEITAVVVLDDGGKCLEFITRGVLAKLPVIGIEQTTAGLFNPAVINLHVPFIDVAACAAKTYLESDMIVEAILNKLSKTLPVDKNGLLCGVVGVGAIGKAIVRHLISLGCHVHVYDQNKENYKFIEKAICYDHLEELIRTTDYIFGCTGRDITQNLDMFSLTSRHKMFISCTSEDKEFLSLLKLIQSYHDQQSNPLKDIVWPLSNSAVITIIKGGFPINFDDSGESVPAHQIQLTRGLLLVALIQAIVTLPFLMKENIKGRVMLNPEAQKFVVQEWLKNSKNHKFSPSLLNKFKNIDWIMQNSGGLFRQADQLFQYFNFYEATQSESAS